MSATTIFTGPNALSCKHVHELATMSSHPISPQSRRQCEKSIKESTYTLRRLGKQVERTGRIGGTWEREPRRSHHFSRRSRHYSSDSVTKFDRPLDEKLSRTQLIKVLKHALSITTTSSALVRHHQWEQSKSRIKS